MIDRKQNCRAYPTSASTLAIGQTRTCRLRLGGNDFVNPDSIRLQYTLTNKGTAPSVLYPAVGPWGVWSLVRLLSGGVEIDHVPYYGRFHQLHGWALLTKEQKFAEAAMGFGGAADADEDIDTSHSSPRLGSIAAGQSVTVNHKLTLSHFTSGKMLPL